MSGNMKVAFIGNPNCGKTTLFNAYTGAKHKVGNWPGVTVEKKEGTIVYKGHKMTLVDLPGVYSLSPYSMEEILTREYIIDASPDVVVNIIDASNLERNLYLTLQLIELGKPVILALNMMDVAKNRGLIIHIDQLKEALNLPVIEVIATKKVGMDDLLQEILETVRQESYDPIQVNYGEEIEMEISKLTTQLGNKLLKQDTLRWHAIKLLERDQEIYKKLNVQVIGHYEEDIAKGKYDYISGFIHQVIEHTADNDETASDRVDKVITNRFAGLPIFMAMMLAVFAFTFKVGNYLAGLLDIVFGAFGDLVSQLLVGIDAAQWLSSLIVDGIIGGVGGILIFLPNIACLFTAISILEDSGYMARVALIMDKFMRKLGLSGKAFIPMILGFGCSVPAIMTARTLEDERDRLIAILITPFMSCSARLPIYILFSRIFFPGNEVLIAFSLYLLGVVIAILVALIFKKTLSKGETAPLILELPAYKKPSPLTIAIYVWEKVKGYMIKAGTVIFVASIIIWFILAFNLSGKTDITHSIGASIGQFISPIFVPLGFGNWQASLSLIAGIMGKEIVVSTMSVIYGIGDLMGDGDTTQFMAQLVAAGFTQLSAYAFMVFSLLYTPCVAALGVIKKETNSWKWMIFSFVYQLAVAWLVAMVVYQIGRLFV
ncbi:ferrous iron transport protein B [Vallitalea pronyensis]|uniref:Ferrous iron transport protein B n=1 Tax=Vallitalea pronyensis TaxID=1348613 RepID=A0A8J8MJJ1_9FIRM|nr:ferrous iron transport protein B [Vallitalea pronyensis]QUI22820.1 ferrous iron transport protein B [Vallitalea pronyensis]